MLIPQMSNKIIVSLDPFIANILTSWDWTVNPFGKVSQLIVSVERLVRFERGWPGTIWCVTSVGATGASVGTAVSYAFRRSTKGLVLRRYLSDRDINMVVSEGICGRSVRLIAECRGAE